MNSREIPGVSMFYSVNQLKNNDTSGNKESAAYCQFITFNGTCHNSKDY